jgi:hypothetical protein
MAATRTQVYLTAEQRARIDELIGRNGQSLAWVIREALDRYLAAPGSDRQAALDATFGVLPAIAMPDRGESNRFPAGPNAFGLRAEMPGVRARSRSRKQWP